MHFANDIFDANSYQDLFRTVILHFARQTLVFFENHKLAGFRVMRGSGEARDEAGYTRDSRGEDKGGVQTLCKHSSKKKYYANTLRRKNIN